MVGAARVFLFGRYRLIPDRRALFRNGNEASIRSRAFDLLLVLLERRDRVVSKEELIKLVWAGRVVDEGNLTVHIAAPEGSFKPWWHQLRIETLGWNSTTHELTSAATKTKLQQSTKSPNSPWTATIPQPTTATDLTLR